MKIQLPFSNNGNGKETETFQPASYRLFALTIGGADETEPENVISVALHRDVLAQQAGNQDVREGTFAGYTLQGRALVNCRTPDGEDIQLIVEPRQAILPSEGKAVRCLDPFAIRNYRSGTPGFIGQLAAVIGAGR